VKRTFLTLDDARWTQCHASTVSPDGRVAAWFAGTREGTPDNRIVLWRAGSTTVLDTGHDGAHWNPVLAGGPDGLLWLFCKVGARISEWVTVVTRSADSGATWEPARELVPGDTSGGRGPVRTPPLLTADGLWLAGGSVERWTTPPRWDPFVDVCTEVRADGSTWERAEIPVDHAALRGAGHIQPSLWAGRTGVVALMRSTEGRAYRSTSPDGRTWTPAEPTGLPNNNSGLAAVALPSGRVACVHNPSSDDWGRRCPLTISVSDDDGQSWRPALVLDDAPDAPASFAPGDAGVRTSGVAEFSYPTAVVHDDELIVTYTWQRRGIVLARLPVAALDDP
jgi:predicted neuraminidase